MRLSALVKHIQNLGVPRPSVPLLSILALGGSLVVVVWVAVFSYLPKERARIQQEIVVEAGNLNTLFQQNVMRTASELDRILQFVRTSRDRLPPDVPWQTLLMERYTINEQAVQMAVIDSTGMMVTSTANLYPRVPVDLSDREHYLFHRNSRDDVLHVSKPLVGRASGRWSIQFTRRLTNASGGFGGVLVISLDPTHLSRILSELNLGKNGGVAVIGNDDIIRSGLGIFGTQLGQGFREGHKIADLELTGSLAMAVNMENGSPAILVSRRVPGYPFEVVVSADGVDNNQNWIATRDNYTQVAWSLTFLASLAISAAVLGQLRHERRLVEFARRDPLTGLGNRLEFQHRLSALTADLGSESSVCLLMIDLDGFKAVNDTLGHPVGDKLLRVVAERLSVSVREHDLVTRLGGDEFAIIVTGKREADYGEGLAKRLCERLGEPFMIEGQQIFIGASVGIATAPTDATDAVDLVRFADLALYRSKTSGRGSYTSYTSGMSEIANHRRIMELDLATAIEKEQFELYYQPIMCTATRRAVGCEALVRWRHPKHGLVSPGTFIPIAEDIGLIPALGAWVLKRACADAMQWPEPLKVAVNVSPRQFACGNFLETVRRALEESRLDPKRLELEITETMMMSCEGRNALIIEELRRGGVSVAMDDFGTGYSSLSYLQRFPLDSIKIDRSFLLALETNPSSLSIIKAIIALANAMGMRTVAEGVESQGQLQLLARIGCNEVQGFLIGRPAPWPETFKNLATNRVLALVAQTGSAISVRAN